jgi:L-idonate 5-dehydrogenase
MTSYKLYGAKDIRLNDAKTEHHENNVLVKIHSVGICGSDIHYYTHGRCGHFIPKDPLTLGHEFSGIVESVPAKTQHIKVGDRVAINPLISCGVCAYCQNDQNSLCVQKKYMGSAAVYPHVQGALSDFISVPVANTFVLPDSVSHVQGTMIEPASVALHAVKKMTDIKNKKILVIGGGTIGQMIMRIAISLGAEVDLCDPKKFCREKALQGGAKNVFDPLVDKIPDLSYEGIFEASGSLPALQAALFQVSKAGSIIQVGTLPDKIEIPGNIIMNKELMLKGSVQFGSEFPEVLAMMAKGQLDLADLNTHRFPFSQTAEAIEFAAQSANAIKVQIEL